MYGTPSEEGADIRVLVYPADLGRCGQRIVWPARTLASQGADIVLGNDYKSDDPVWNETADVVVMQRPMHRRFVEPYLDDLGRWTPGGDIQMLQSRGVRVVVDIDDDFMALNAKNAVWERTHPSTSPDCNPHHLSAACRLADLVTVSTPRLARRYATQGRVAIIPNHIPESYLTIEHPVNDRVVVGWTGAVGSHPDDLQVTRGGVARAVEGTGARFHMVGPLEGVQDALGLSEEPTATGMVDIDDYPFEMAQIDVGIVPLELTKFNHAKSWLKMMEFAALGIPSIGSPTDPNTEFARRYGLPLAAARSWDWERSVRRLVLDRSHREELGAACREAMHAETIERNAHLWIEAWERAHARGRKLVKT